MPPILSGKSYKKLRRTLLVFCFSLLFAEYSELSLENDFFDKYGIYISNPNIIIDLLWLIFIYLLIKFTINSNKWSSIDFNSYKDRYFKKTLLPNFDKLFPGLVGYQAGLISSIDLSLKTRRYNIQNLLIDGVYLPAQPNYFEYRLFSIPLKGLCRYLPLAKGTKCGGKINLIWREATPCSKIMHDVRVESGLLYWLFYPSIKKEKSRYLPSGILPLSWSTTFHTALGRKYFVNHDNILGTLYLPLFKGLPIKIKSYIYIYLQTNYYFDNKLPFHFGASLIIYRLREHLFQLILYIKGFDLIELLNKISW